jgi:hypothetical protein
MNAWSLHIHGSVLNKAQRKVYLYELLQKYLKEKIPCASVLPWSCMGKWTYSITY